MRLSAINYLNNTSGGVFINFENNRDKCAGSNKKKIIVLK